MKLDLERIFTDITLALFAVLQVAFIINLLIG